MDNVAYILASKQMSAVKNLDVVANNVANVNTNGFKSDSMIFKEYMHQDVIDKTSMTGPQVTTTNFGEGALKVTQNAFDLAISGNGMFIIRTPAGDRYTKSGHFRLNQEGVLVNGDGYPVLSFDKQEIVFEDGDADPIIGSNGTIFVGTAIRGQVGVAEFNDLNSVRKLGNGLFTSDIEPNEAEGAKVIQGSLEESNVNSIRQITILTQIEKDVVQTTRFINDIYSMQRDAFKIYAKVGG